MGENVPDRGLSEADWDDLLDLIESKRCTPFIGAGASVDEIPAASGLAGQWAAEYDYPLTDDGSLSRVAQFLSIRRYPMYPKLEVQRIVRAARRPDFDEPDEPHASLARLDLPIYITTNYDDFMVQALRHRGHHPRFETCRWNTSPPLKGAPSAFVEGYEPSSSQPLVFHLHGHQDIAESIVITEDDYLDFLVELSRTPALLPSDIMSALAATALVFVGYGLTDWTFRVVLRMLMRSMTADLRLPCVAIQLPPEHQKRAKKDREAEARAYLSKYFEGMQRLKLKVYWGTAREFARDLNRMRSGVAPAS